MGVWVCGDVVGVRLWRSQASGPCSFQTDELAGQQTPVSAPNFLFLQSQKEVHTSVLSFSAMIIAYYWHKTQPTKIAKQHKHAERSWAWQRDMYVCSRQNGLAAYVHNKLCIACSFACTLFWKYCSFIDVFLHKTRATLYTVYVSSYDHNHVHFYNVCTLCMIISLHKNLRISYIVAKYVRIASYIGVQL